MRKMLLLIARLSTSLSFFSSLILVPWLLIIKIALLRCCCGLFVYSNEHLMANSKLVRCHTHTHTYMQGKSERKSRESIEKSERKRNSDWAYLQRFSLPVLHFTLFPNLIFITLFPVHFQCLLFIFFLPPFSLSLFIHKLRGNSGNSKVAFPRYLHRKISSFYGTSFVLIPVGIAYNLRMLISSFRA